MALTPEEKARRKEAQKARDRAYRARRKERDEAKERMEAELQAAEETRRFNDACAAADQLDADLNSTLADIDEQIRALVLKKETVRQQFAPRREAARAERDVAWKEMDAKRRSIDVRLNEMFPDFVGPSYIWSAPTWDARRKALEGAK